MRRLVALGCAVAASACGPAELEPAAEDRCEEPTASVAEELSSIDCTEASDTGYSSGSPFPITVVTVDGKPVERDTANAYYVMAQAADAAGVTLKVVSGFRTMAEQQYFYNCYVNCNCNNCNLAAKPGYSNHQSGHALDLNTSSAGVYAWLEANGAAFGFKRTVPSEAWHWEWWGGGPGGGPCGNKKPTGYLDAAGCDALKGWAQDPDAPTAPIDVHLYLGGPAGSGAPGKSVSANVTRPDLCSAIGSCDHGFSIAPPLSLFDGQPHAVHAYGIDSAGGANAELGQSPQNLTCTASAPAGIRRHVQNPDSFSAWKLDLFWQKLPLDDATIAAIPEKTPLPLLPELVQADDGSPEVWLVDGAWRRHVPSPAVMAAWGLAFADVKSKPAAEVSALKQGPPVRPSPVLLQATSGKIDLIDDAFPGEAGAGGAGGAGGWGGGSGGGIVGNGGNGGTGANGSTTKVLADDEGGCDCSQAGERRAPLRAWAFGLLLALGLFRASGTGSRATPARTRRR